MPFSNWLIIIALLVATPWVWRRLHRRTWRFMAAAKVGQVDVLESLLATGTPVDAREAFGKKTVLMYAARYGQTKTVQLLLKAGADIEAASDFWHLTPLAWAASRDHPETVDALLLAGAVINDEVISRAKGRSLSRIVEAIQRDHRVTFLNPLDVALVRAAEDQNVALVKILLQAGAKTSAFIQRSERTAISAAVKAQHIELVRILVAAGEKCSIYAFDALEKLPNPTHELQLAVRGEDMTCSLNTCANCRAPERDGRFYRFHYGRRTDQENSGPLVTTYYKTLGSGASFICNQCAHKFPEAKRQERCEWLAWKVDKTIADKKGLTVWSLRQFSSPFRR